MKIIRNLFLTALLFALGFVCAEALLQRHGSMGTVALWELARLFGLPDHDYLADIAELRREGHLGEARELARYVATHPDLPRSAEAARIEKELDREISSFWGKSRRAVRGFVFGEGSTVEAMGGAIASDLVLYGDIRDLVKQSYYKSTGRETDPVLAALAGLGIATELLPHLDWGPAVLKVFRKAGALSRNFAGWIARSARRSTRLKRLDPALASVFKGVRTMTDTVGLPRTTRMFRHVDAPADVALLSRMVSRNGDAAYLAIKNGGGDGMRALRRMDGISGSGTVLATAARKGPRGVQMLVRPPSRISTLAARMGKTLRAERFQTMLLDWMHRRPEAIFVAWAGLVVGLGGGIFRLARTSGRIFRGRRIRNPG